MLYAPRDGSKIELLVEHREYWIALKNNRADGYRQECVGQARLIPITAGRT